MLTLILAAPRTGKSQYAVSLMYKHRQEGKLVFTTNFNQTDEQRQKMGVTVFDTPNEWWEKLPPGSVWFIDEAQDIWPQRSKHKELPEYIKLLSKHGHHDLTIYIITQDAMQLDVHVRRNSNMTLYLTRPLNLSRALVYTFRGYQEMPNDAWRRSQVLKSAESKAKFKYQKKFQDSYVSASAHEHIKKRFPKRLLILPIGVIIVLYSIYSAYTGLRKTADDAPSPLGAVAGVVDSAGAPTTAAPAAPSSSPSQGEALASLVDYEARFRPRVADLPWTAPAYDQFAVKDYPRAFCYITDLRCKCVTQQNTPLKVGDEFCREVAQHGYWDPFKEPMGQVKQVASKQPDEAQKTAPQGVSGTVGEFRIMDEPQGLPGGVVIPAESAPEPILPMARPSGSPQVTP